MPAVPVFQEYMNPILDVLRRAGAPKPIEEVDRLVIEAMKLAPDVVSVPHDPEKPDRSEVSYRIAWARTYLKKAGLLANPKRGIWGVAEKGLVASPVDAYALASEVGATYESKHGTKGSPASASGDGASSDDDDQDDVEPVDEELVAARVSEELARELREVHARLALKGRLVSPADVARFQRRFRDEHGPDVLRNLDGEALLLKMHARGHDSLMYWLEFKDDDEFRAPLFGSIAGGSALKFGIYQAAESGHWITGNSKKQERLALADAVAYARKQRDQLVAAYEAVEAAAGSKEIDFAALQSALDAVAPDVAESAWGHKYLTLLFPAVLPPIHSVGYETHQLYKLLKIPQSGHYENARIFVGVAAQLGISLHELASTLNERNGGSVSYFRIGTTDDDGRSEWDRMRLGGFASMGWGATGDLSGIPHDPGGRNQIRERVVEKYGVDGGAATKAANQIFRFLATAQPRDVVVAMEGSRVRAIGQIVGGYKWAPDDGPFPHRRPVRWLRVGEWKLPVVEGLRTTFVPINKAVNIIDTEARLLGTPIDAAPESLSRRAGTKVAAAVTAPAPLPVLEGVVARIDAILERKRQVILYGPPGTGKTYWAEHAIEALAARAWFQTPSLSPEQRIELREAGAIDLCAFHPAYGYEDFLEGYRPREKSGQLSFALEPGIFKRLCANAAKQPRRPFFLLIDEINRGDIPRIFGELLTVLEREKRGKAIRLPLSGEAFVVPENVYVIGTMNTADRSIALLDAALRRRFGFVELLPDSGALKGASVGGLPLGRWLDELNRRVIESAGRDARHLQVGHSYLMPTGAPVREVAQFVQILRDDILPLLEEYCYEDFAALERILGEKLMVRERQRFDDALFEPERHQELIERLLSAFQNVVRGSAPEATQDDQEDPPESDPDLEASAAGEGTAAT